MGAASPCWLLPMNEISYVMEQRGRVPWEMVSQFELMFKKKKNLNLQCVSNLCVFDFFFY